MKEPDNMWNVSSVKWANGSPGSFPHWAKTFLNIIIIMKIWLQSKAGTSQALLENGKQLGLS